MPTNIRLWQFTILMSSALATAASAADAPSGPEAQAVAPADAKPFKAEELAQLVAPIALYPDSLLAQIFMASTYPLEIVQADRWAKENKDTKSDVLAAALEKNNWDPSVKSLVNFPQVLSMMSKQLDWTTKLGDAFIADQKAVMAAVQTLRAKAKAEGTLKDSAEQKVILEQPAPQTVVVQGAAPPPQIIRIESPSPEVVYVPTYNPAVVYGAWPYPAYPPYPPPHPVASNLVAFGAGVAVGAAWGYAWGGCNWGHGDVDIDVNRNANINRNIDRQAYAANLQNRTANLQRGDRNAFAHDPGHRKGVAYRDQATARQVGQFTPSMDTARARDAYRGRAEAGRQDIARGGADQLRGGSALDRGGAPGGARDISRTGGAGTRTPAAPGRSATPQARGGAFDGVDRGGAAARSSSARGQASRSAPSRPPPSAAPRGGSGGGRMAAGAPRGGGAGGGGRGGRR